MIYFFGCNVRFTRRLTRDVIVIRNFYRKNSFVDKMRNMYRRCKYKVISSKIFQFSVRLQSKSNSYNKSSKIHSWHRPIINPYEYFIVSDILKIWPELLSSWIYSHVFFFFGGSGVLVVCNFVSLGSEMPSFRNKIPLT